MAGIASLGHAFVRSTRPHVSTEQYVCLLFGSVMAARNNISAGHLGGIAELCPFGHRRSPSSGSAVAEIVVSIVPDFTLPPSSCPPQAAASAVKRRLPLL